MWCAFSKSIINNKTETNNTKRERDQESRLKTELSKLRVSIRTQLKYINVHCELKINNNCVWFTIMSKQMCMENHIKEISMSERASHTRMCHAICCYVCYQMWYNQSWSWGLAWGAVRQLDKWQRSLPLSPCLEVAPLQIEAALLWPKTDPIVCLLLCFVSTLGFRFSHYIWPAIEYTFGLFFVSHK